MGPRFSTLHDTSFRNRPSPVTSGEVHASTDRVESRPGYEGPASRYGWMSASRHRHVALLDTIRGRASRQRRGGSSKPAVAAAGASAGGPLHQHGGTAASSASSGADKRVWAKLIARLSRKMGATRLTTSRSSAGGGGQQPAADNGVELHPGHGAGAGAGLIRGTSSVLPVSRNPVTTTLAYNDNSKQFGGDNNVPSADFASRVNCIKCLSCTIAKPHL